LELLYLLVNALVLSVNLILLILQRPALLHNPSLLLLRGSNLLLTFLKVRLISLIFLSDLLCVSLSLLELSDHLLPLSPCEVELVCVFDFVSLELAHLGLLRRLLGL
jgi:hypothetical protein